LGKKMGLAAAAKRESAVGAKTQKELGTQTLLGLDQLARE